MGGLSAIAGTGSALEDCPGESEDETRFWRTAKGVEEGRFKFVSTEPNPIGETLSLRYGMAQCTKCTDLFNCLHMARGVGPRPHKDRLLLHLAACFQRSDVKYGCGLTLEQLKSANEGNTKKARGHMKNCAEQRERTEKVR